MGRLRSQAPVARVPGDSELWFVTTWELVREALMDPRRFSNVFPPARRDTPPPEIAAEVEAGRFRKDLYFRLSSAVLVLPPLRDRKRELPLLSRAFLREACQKLGKPELSLSGAALECMGRYGWPGNVRELKNAMQFAAATSTDPVLSPWHLPEEIGTAVPSPAAAIPAHAAASLAALAAALLRLQVPDKLAAIESALVAAALKLSAGNKSQAARLLGVHRKVVERRTDKR